MFKMTALKGTPSSLLTSELGGDGDNNNDIDDDDDDYHDDDKT